MRLISALALHGHDDRVRAGLGLVPNEDNALATGLLISVWPVENDGRYELGLGDTAGYIVWRSFLLSEIDSGRGTYKDLPRYRAILGIETEMAAAFVSFLTKDLGIRPCQKGEWSDPVKHFLGLPARPGFMPHKYYRAIRRKTRRALQQANLTTLGRATALFEQPRKFDTALDAADEEVLILMNR